MSRLISLVALAACAGSSPPPPAAPPENHVVEATPPAVAALPGPRAVITHAFLQHPISVVDPTSEDIIVSTATGSVMLVTLDLSTGPAGVTMMLSADGKSDTLPPLDPNARVIDHGDDAQMAWRITELAGVTDVDAVNRATGVYCAIYKPEVHTVAAARTVLAACRDIRVATPAEVSGGVRVFSG